MKSRLPAAALSLLLCAAGVASLWGADLGDSLDVVAATNRSASESQQEIDRLDRETRILLEEYRSLRESSGHQQAYTRELELLDASQKERIESLKRQIARARITRQRILPMMRSMADALEKFVVLDLPFHQQERVGAVLQLKQRLDNPALSVAARFRLLLEAYQIEQGYSASVEAWRGPLSVEGQDLSVEFLRLGRTALYYQSLDRSRCAYWDRASQDWIELPPEHNRPLFQAIRVALSQTAPQLLQLPIKSSGANS